jgi:bifunctional non-homologous end joining protein LigD
LLERKALLKDLLARSAVHCLVYTEHFDEALPLLKMADRLGFEGVVSKRRDAAYRCGRNSSWKSPK